MPVDSKRLQSVFLAALEAEDRAALLDRECGQDAELRQRVEKLLVAHDDSADLPAADGPTGAYIANPGESLAPGSVFAGRYKLREKLGEGGMGVVYVADQTEPVQRRVALKIIRANLPTQTLLARFEQERQALALMDHPNIAKVYDAGVSDNTPFFVMEMIKGVSITKYCDDAKLTPQQRLELFIPVCHAVQHAHQKGIIHRDLKPSNIIVGLYDGRPVPKVIDFGVAKMSGPKMTEHSVYTEAGSIIGTLEYMSPEQAELNNLDIDTRSDIYALGVILYELLTGTVPFSRKEMEKAGFAEMLRVIKEQEPSKPSTKLSGSGNLPSVAACRHTEPVKLTRLVRGELDWITMKALEKDRSRRYETANGFAADINRYLAGEPVLAHPPTLWYRYRKFSQRHRGAILATYMLLVGIVIFTGSLYSQMERAKSAERAAIEAQQAETEQRRRAEANERQAIDAATAEKRAREAAQAKEAEANAVVKFFEDQVFAAARPKGQDGGLGKDVTLRDAIAASLSALGKSFAAQPLVEARLRQTLGITFDYLAEYEQARVQFEQSRVLFARHRGPDHPDTLRSMNNLAVSYESLNRPAEALKLREEVLEIQKRVLPKDHPDTLTSMSNLANSYAALNRNAEALKLREDVLEIQMRVLLRDHPDTLKSMTNLASSYAALNRHAEALKLREDVLEIQKRVLPQDHPDTLKSMNNLAISYTALNRQAEAVKLNEEVLAIQKRVLPKDHPDTLTSMWNLALRYESLNRLAEALRLREEVLEIRQRVLPKDHRDTVKSMHALANSYVALNRHAEALKLREEVLAILKRVLPKDHPDTLRSMWGLAETLSKLDRGAEAIPHIDGCVAKAAGPAVHSGMIPSVMVLRIGHFQKVGDPAGCRATAEMWEKLNRTDTESLYNAACFRSVTAGVQAKTPGANAARLAKEDADKSMAWLTKTVAAGYKDVAHMKKDTDLDPLRDREDFKKLIAELEAQAMAEKRTP